MVIHPSSVVADLDDSAFGAAPSRWPLAEATTPSERWVRAVALGGQGRYGAAHAELDALFRVPGVDGSLRSLALSTTGSLLRQLGWHQLARGYDGRALACAGADPDALADARIGLAADALGLGRFALAQTLLDGVECDGGRLPWRTPLRHAWVRAELAMVSGQGAQSLAAAREAQRLADAVPSTRHRVKTSMVLAAALSSAGQLDESAQVAGYGLAAATEAGLTPLRWALAAMLSGLASDESAGEMVAVRAECARWIRCAGGRWSSEATD